MILPRRVFGRERLSSLFRQKTIDTTTTLQTASIESINSDGTVDLRLVDGVRYSVPVGSWYTPATGDSVKVMRADPFSLFVLGTVKDTNATTVNVATNFLFPYNVTSVPVSDPGGDSGTETFQVTDTKSWRHLDGWSRIDVYQGAYSSSYGYWSGCYFYGSAPQNTLKGKTVTSGTIRLHRKSEGGNSANVPQYIAPHAHKSQPSSSPNFTASARNVGLLDWGEAHEFSLPKAWLQKLVDGDPKVHGFGHRISATGSKYSIAYNDGGDSNTGRLTIHWKS